MKRTSINRIPVIGTIILMLSGCGGAGERQQTPGIRLSDLDTTAVIGNDFYQYAGGGWMANNPLQGRDMERDAFAVVRDSVNERLKNLITGLAAAPQRAGTIEQKIADFYNTAMDSVKLNEQGAEPIRPMLDKLEAITSKEQLIPMIVELGRETGASPYFTYGSFPDMADSRTRLLAINQGGLGLMQKEYYFMSDPGMDHIRGEYRKFIVSMFRLAGLSEADATRKMQDVLDVETNLARGARTASEMRDPQANYHRMTVDELKDAVVDFNWDVFLKELGLPDVKYVDLRQVEPMRTVARVLDVLPVSKHVSYLQFNLLNQSGSYLSDAMFDARFNFYGRIFLGMEQPSARWERAVENMNDHLGEPIGRMYVETYFPAQAKKRMVGLVENLRTTLAGRIEAQTWMTDNTKTRAIEKLNAMDMKIGYPDKWEDYSDLEIKTDSYWANICRVKVREFAGDIRKVGKPVDRKEWETYPQTVNASYYPQQNAICFPAAILQPPFFDMDADDAYNYGAIGTVIGHEMTHGFDDQGRHFDKDGNLTEWWNRQDAEAFNRRVQVLVDYYNGIEVLPGLYINGALTLGETIADHGGVNVAYGALQRAMKSNPLTDKDGFTPEQRFFLSFGRLWASNAREELLRYITQNDVHPANKWRVNGTLPHIGPWYDAFGITPEDSMYLAPEARVDIW